MKYYVSIETNVKGFEFFKDLWAKKNIHGIMANSMSEGIERVIEIENRRMSELYFVDIVADDIKDYMERLRDLRKKTTAPILIATSKGTAQRKTCKNKQVRG